MAEDTRRDAAQPAGENLEESKPRHVAVNSDQDGQRVDNFLIRQCNGVPRSHIYQLIRKGSVLVNGKRVKQTRRLIAGEKVRIPAIRLKPVTDTHVPARLAELAGSSVLFEHRDFLIVDKPVGIAVHGGSGLAFGFIDAMRQYRDEKRLELAHRLDRATSGCLLIGRGLKNTRELQDLFRQRVVEKRYLALVDGQWPEDVVQIDAPLVKNAAHAGERRVIVSPHGQPSLTHVTIRQRFVEATLLDVTLDTGRTHQIRVHTRHVGHAIVGDERYADNRRNTFFRQRGLSRLYLHASALEFDWRGQRIRVKAPTDSRWNQSLSQLSSR